MKLKFLVVSLAVLLSACSTFSSKKDEPKVNTEFMGGSIKVSYTLSGDLESVTSSGVAKVTSTLPSAPDEAYLVATLQARKQLVEFMKVELESTSFVTAVSKTLQDSESESDKTVKSNVSAKIASDVQDNIRQNSKALLKGTYVESKTYDPSTRTVKVIVKTSLRDLDTSKQLARMMGN
jgi:hypothetical protein